MAADMPPALVANSYDWSGMYIGGVLGGAKATNDIDPGRHPKRSSAYP
jgi:hypothetical protein